MSAARGTDALLTAYLALFFAYLFLPLALMVAAAFNANPTPSAIDWHGFTLEWFRALPRDERFVRGLGHSAVIAAGVIVVAIPCGLAGALVLSRLRSRTSTPLYAVLVSPVLTPGIVLGATTMIFWRDAFGLQAGLFTTVMAQASFIAAYCMLLFMARLQRQDRTLEDAASDLGASPTFVFRRITLPFLGPTILTASLLAALQSFENYNTTFFAIGGSWTLVTEIGSRMRFGLSPDDQRDRRDLHRSDGDRRGRPHDAAAPGRAPRVRIRLACLPAHEPYLPKPAIARGHLPDWLREMPPSAPSETLAGAEVRTVKRCPPFLDAMQSGVLFPLATDVRVAGGELSWDWDLPPAPGDAGTRSPLGVHVPEQATGLPRTSRSDFVVKFTNFWTLSLPAGWSMLFGHPANRLELPFRTLTGLVDCDAWAPGRVHFPARWTDPGFEGVLPAGTPVAQGWPVRREPLELECGALDEAGMREHAALQAALQDAPGLYRRRYRASRSPGAEPPDG